MSHLLTNLAALAMLIVTRLAKLFALDVMLAAVLGYLPVRLRHQPPVVFAQCEGVEAADWRFSIALIG